VESVGAREGLLLGDFDGESVGAADGSIDGIFVGSDVGSTLGAVVGGEVGLDGQSPLQVTEFKSWILIKVQTSSVSLKSDTSGSNEVSWVMAHE